MCHLSALGDVVNILFVKKKGKRKIFLLYFAIRRRNEGVVTYGIRAGSTRDLGFTTDVLITVGVFGVLHLICVLTAIRAFGGNCIWHSFYH
jgi:hypothetical protein